MDDPGDLPPSIQPNSVAVERVGDVVWVLWTEWPTAGDTTLAGVRFDAAGGELLDAEPRFLEYGALAGFTTRGDQAVVFLSGYQKLIIDRYGIVDKSWDGTPSIRNLVGDSRGWYTEHRNWNDPEFPSEYAAGIHVLSPSAELLETVELDAVTFAWARDGDRIVVASISDELVPRPNRRPNQGARVLRLSTLDSSLALAPLLPVDQPVASVAHTRETTTVCEDDTPPPPTSGAGAGRQPDYNDHCRDEYPAEYCDGSCSAGTAGGFAPVMLALLALLLSGWRRRRGWTARS
jgi:MYXO-CTERM domain-containing protein